VDGDGQTPRQHLTIEICDYLDRQCKMLEDKWLIRHESLEEKYEKSEQQIQEAKRDLEKRLDEMNQERARSDRKEGSFISSDTLDTKLSILSAKIEGKISNLWVAWGSLSIAIIVLAITHFMGKL
jgi:hypothetical protein